ncbi:MAG: hypothetical protein AAGI46_01285 [Planctomycetota bacterium]
MPYTKRTGIALIAGSLMFAAQSGAATVADLGGDWAGPTTGGTAAGWSYFESNALSGGTELSLTPNILVGNGGNRGFAGSSDFPFNLAAILGDRNDGAQFELFSDGDANSPVEGVDLLFHPSASAGGRYVIARRTITSADLTNGSQATITGSFRNLLSPFNSVSVFVLQNGAQLFTANGNDPTGSDGDTRRLSEADGSFNIQTSVALDDTIDFIVFSNGDRSADETAVRATITVVPEPTSLAAGAVGGLLLLRRRR